MTTSHSQSMNSKHSVLEVSSGSKVKEINCYQFQAVKKNGKIKKNKKVLPFYDYVEFNQLGNIVHSKGTFGDFIDYDSLFFYNENNTIDFICFESLSKEKGTTKYVYTENGTLIKKQYLDSTENLIKIIRFEYNSDSTVTEKLIKGATIYNWKIQNYKNGNILTQDTYYDSVGKIIRKLEYTYTKETNGSITTCRWFDERGLYAESQFYYNDNNRIIKESVKFNHSDYLIEYNYYYINDKFGNWTTSYYTETEYSKNKVHTKHLIFEREIIYYE